MLQPLTMSYSGLMSCTAASRYGCLQSNICGNLQGQFYKTPLCNCQGDQPGCAAYLQLMVTDGAECDGYAVCGHVVHQGWVLQAVYAVVNALRTQHLECLPHILRASLFTCAHIQHMMTDGWGDGLFMPIAWQVTCARGGRGICPQVQDTANRCCLKLVVVWCEANCQPYLHAPLCAAPAAPPL